MQACFLTEHFSLYYKNSHVTMAPVKLGKQAKIGFRPFIVVERSIFPFKYIFGNDFVDSS